MLLAFFEQFFDPCIDTVRIPVLSRVLSADTLLVRRPPIALRISSDHECSLPADLANAQPFHVICLANLFRSLPPFSSPLYLRLLYRTEVTLRWATFRY